MEKNNIDENRYLYVCEGKTDSEKLKKLGCLFVVETGGKYIQKECWKKIFKKRKRMQILF